MKNRPLEHRVADYAETLQRRVTYLRSRAKDNAYQGTWGARILNRQADELEEVAGALAGLTLGHELTELPLAPCVDHGSTGCPRPRHCPEHRKYMRTQEDDPYTLSRRCRALYDINDSDARSTAGPFPGPCIACGRPSHSYSPLCTHCDNYDDMHQAETTSATARPVHKDHIPDLPKTEHHFQQFAHELGVAWRAPSNRPLKKAS